MHSSVPNTSGKTSFSRFQGGSCGRCEGGKGAPRVDKECTGTTMRDYLRGTDFSHIPDDIVALYDDGTDTAGELLYRPK